MANASTGERLLQRHGVALYSAQTTKGTPVTPATSCGACLWSRENNSNNEEVRGPGSPNVLAFRGGTVETTLGLRFSHLQTGGKALVQKVARSAGVAPWLTIGVGYQDDESTPNRYFEQIQDAKVESLRLSYNLEGGHTPIAADLNLKGGLITELTTLAPATLSTTPWMSQDAHFTRNGSGYEIVGMEVEIGNSLMPTFTTPGSAPSSYHRGFKQLAEGDITVRGSLTLQKTAGVALLGQTISTFPAVWTATNPDDSVQLILTFANMVFDRDAYNLTDNGHLWTIDYRAISCTIT